MEYRQIVACIRVVELVLMVSRPAMSVSEDFYDLASNEKLVVLATRRANQELRLFMVLVPPLHASMRREDPDAMLCSFVA